MSLRVWHVLTHGASVSLPQLSGPRHDVNGLITSCVFHAFVRTILKHSLNDFFGRSGLVHLMDYMEFYHPKIKLRLLCPAFFFDKHAELVDQVAERGHCLLSYSY